MSIMRIAGIIIAVVGVVLLVTGLNSSDAPVDQLSETFTGRYTDETMRYIVGGIAAIVGGGLLAAFARR